MVNEQSTGKETSQLYLVVCVQSVNVKIVKSPIMGRSIIYLQLFSYAILSWCIFSIPLR